MRRLILIALALGSIWFACSQAKEADVVRPEAVQVKPVAVSPEAVAALQPSATVECPGAANPGSPCNHEQGHKIASPQAVDGERVFGGPLKDKGDPLTVGTLLDDPKPYLGKVVKAKGTVSRVCEKAGCWLELASVQGGAGLRVPMANHAFFIPADAIGRPAIVEGQLHAQPLPAAHREHLAGEGAQALGPLSLAATTVVVQ
jgi:hypothetical protein